MNNFARKYIVKYRNKYLTGDRNDEPQPWASGVDLS